LRLDVVKSSRAGCPRGAAQATPSGAGNRKLARDEGAS